MTNRARLLARVHGLDPNGIVWAIEPDGTRHPVYSVNNLSSEYAKLLAAAPLMLRAIDCALPMLDTIVQAFELHNLEHYAPHVMTLEGALNTAKNYALIGYEPKKDR